MVKKFDNTFYVKLSALCFVLGGFAEAFKIYTGYYRITAKTDAERYLEALETKEVVRQEVIKRFTEKNLPVPDFILEDKKY